MGDVDLRVVDNRELSGAGKSDDERPCLFKINGRFRDMGKGERNKRIKRSKQELLVSLCKHLYLLRKYYNSAFVDGDMDYLGEIAGKLRLLAVKTRTNKPLLVNLMNEFDVNIKIETVPKMENDVPVSLDEYMEMLCISVRKGDGQMAMFNHREFVLAWAQQSGSAHEDWEHDEDFSTVRSPLVKIGGVDAHAASLGAIAKTVLYVGDRFIQELQKQGNNKKQG